MDCCPESGNTVEGNKEELSYQDHHQNQKQQKQQQPISAGIFPEQFHPKDISQHTPPKVPLQASANWVSPKQNDYYTTPQQQLVLAPQHPPSPNNYPLPSSQYSGQEPDHHSARVPSRNVSYEEFIAAEDQQSSSSTDPKTGFPKSWPKVSPPPPAKVTSPPVEQPSPAKVFSPPAKKPSPSNVPWTFLPPSSPPSRSCSCCIIL